MFFLIEGAWLFPVNLAPAGMGRDPWPTVTQGDLGEGQGQSSLSEASLPTSWESGGVLAGFSEVSLPPGALRLRLRLAQPEQNPAAPSEQAARPAPGVIHGEAL